jgi:predicted DNA-binding protein with PD1-like motif
VALRLEPGEEIYARLREIAAGRSMFVVSCVGSVTSVGLRLAGYTSSDANNVTRVENKLRFYDAHFEIVSLTGSLCADGLHLHMSMSDAQGRVLGGHLKYATVFTTAEILLAVLPDYTLSRLPDSRTGFPELVVAPLGEEGEEEEDGEEGPGSPNVERGPDGSARQRAASGSRGSEGARGLAQVWRLHECICLQ